MESKRAPLWKRMPTFLRTALSWRSPQGDDILAIDHHLARNSASSSLDEMLENHRLPAPGAPEDHAGLAARDAQIDSAEDLLRTDELVKIANAIHGL